MTMIASEAEDLRRTLHEAVDQAFDRWLAAKDVPDPRNAPCDVRMPTLHEAADPRNKNGVNLTERGVEMLHRLLDDGWGYNRIAKAMGITQGAVKHRKQGWLQAGGAGRVKTRLDIDPV